MTDRSHLPRFTVVPRDAVSLDEIADAVTDKISERINNQDVVLIKPNSRQAGVLRGEPTDNADKPGD